MNDSAKIDLSLQPPFPIPDQSKFIDPWNDPVWIDALMNMRAEFGEIRLLGVSSIRERSAVELGSLYVPLRLKRESGSDESSSASEVDLLANEGRIIVLGDPGAGKTTLVSMLIINAAKRSNTMFAERLGKM